MRLLHISVFALKFVQARFLLRPVTLVRFLCSDIYIYIYIYMAHAYVYRYVYLIRLLHISVFALKCVPTRFLLAYDVGSCLVFGVEVFVLFPG